MWTTADLVDLNENLPSCAVQFRAFGKRQSFFGSISTISCYEDNALIKQQLSTPGHGRVLIVDGQGSVGCALVGDVIAALGATNGWAGVIVHGAVRDSMLLDQMDFCVKALGTNPKKSSKTAAGAVDVPVEFGGVIFAPGKFVYSDSDGIVVSPSPVV